MKEEILRLLRSADGYISGQELCNRFGVSRTAVWKAINQLKEAGYEIEAQQNKGYKLMAAPDLMTEAEIKSLMHTDWVAKEVLYFDTIDSTNIKAQELAEKGYPSGTLVVADKQESGKGRRGRSWVSPSGTGIFMTLMIKPDINPNNASMLTLVAALAVAKAITSVTGEEALIKWPNDIVVNSKKVCGILTEMNAQFDYINHIVVGIGINVHNESFDWKNFTDPFRVLKGYGQAVSLMKKLKPDVVFSKGGFVSVPVVLAAKHCHVPAIIHESDITPGLANKIAIKGAKKVCCNFPETMKYLPADKAVLTGSPIRRELFSGVAENAIKLCNFPDHNKPVILIIGGSLGSKKVNEAVREILPELLKDFYVIHLCGKGNLDNKLAGITGYAQFEYANAELTDMFALADMAISRAGANSICELLALHKPNILIPLSAAASRGDQVLNAKSFKKQGFSYVIEEEELTKDSLLSAVKEVYGNRDKYKDAMAKSGQMDSIATIIDLINSQVKKSS